MSNTAIPSVQRISKTTKKWMLFFAAFFDLLAVFAVILFTLYIAYEVASSFGTEIAMLNSGLENIEDNFINPDSGAVFVAAAVSGGVKVAAGSAAAFFAGPLLYTLMSFIATFCAYIIFTIWFFTKGVNIWSFNSVERVGINMVSGLIEFIPILNLLPGITVMVWRHIKISQKEDQAKEAERLKKIQTQLQNSGQNSSRQRVSPALRAV